LLSQFLAVNLNCANTCISCTSIWLLTQRKTLITNGVNYYNIGFAGIYISIVWKRYLFANPVTYVSTAKLHSWVLYIHSTSYGNYATITTQRHCHFHQIRIIAKKSLYSYRAIFCDNHSLLAAYDTHDAAAGITWIQTSVI